VGGGNQPSECSQSAGKELAWRDLASATTFICLFLPAGGSGCGLLHMRRIATKVSANRAAAPMSGLPGRLAAGRTEKAAADDNK